MSATSAAAGDTVTSAVGCEQPRLDIVCVPDMEWDHALWTNRQHVMWRLPAISDDIRVLYVSPPRWALTRVLGGGGRLGRRDSEAGVRVATGLQQVRERLWVLQPLLPVPNRTLRRRAPGALDAFVVSATRHAIRRLGFRRPVLWAYSPLAWPLVGRLGERLVCYDVVDDYCEQGNYRQLGAYVREWDRLLTRRADLVFTASPAIQSQRERLNDRCHLVGNAADVEAFARARDGRLPRPGDLPPPPVVGFHGAVTDDKLDLPLILELAAKRPQWSFVLVGPVAKGAARELSTRSNIQLLGPRARGDLPSYLAAFDVCIAPYRRTAYTEGTRPLKVIECLAAGRRLVATDLPGFRDTPGGVEVAADARAFEAVIDRALGHPAAPPDVDLTTFSWEVKAARELRLLAQALKREEGEAGGA